MPFYYKPQSILEYAQCAFYAVSSFITALFNLIKYKPERLITTGGICAIPVALAAVCLFIPVDLYVLDSVPGKALSALAPFATNIYCCFDSAKNYFSGENVFFAHYPIRYSHDAIITQKRDACNYLGLDCTKKVLLVLGGSQGSTFLNDFIMKWICDNPDRAFKISIIHQYGNDVRRDWNSWYANNHTQAITFDYAADLSLYYAAADIVIARAGAGTIFELQAFSKKTILIPLETVSTNHQIDNAVSIVRMYPDLFNVVSQKDVEKNPQYLYQHLNALVT